MKAGEVFLGGHYGELLAEGKTEFPAEAKEGPYALGAMIMVSAASLGPDFRIPDLADWFPARVCLPPPVPGQWYRWYDPFIWYETDGPIHIPVDHSPPNMSYVGKLWSSTYKPDSREQWAYPIAEWKRLFVEVPA